MRNHASIPALKLHGVRTYEPGECQRQRRRLPFCGRALAFQRRARHGIQLRAPLSSVGSPDEFPNMLLSQLVNVDSNLLAPCGFLQHDPNERPESVLFVRVPGQPSIPVNISRRKTERYGSSSKPSSSRPDEYPRKALHSRHNKVWVLYTRATTGTQRVSSEFWLFLQH
jgi:hypothetical protein